MPVTQADIDAAQSAVDKNDEEIKKQVKKVDGATLNTQLDAERKVKGSIIEYALKKLTLKIEGGFFKFQVGASDTIIYGFKGEYIAPLSVAFIAGADIKTVVGLSKTTIMGAKLDNITGAKVDLLMGIKHEAVGGDTIKGGAAPVLKKESKSNEKLDKVKNAFANWATKATNRLFKATEVSTKSGAVQEQIKTLEQKIKSFSQTGATWTADVGTLKQDCSAKASYEAGKVQFSSNGWQMRGSNGGSCLNMFPSSQVTLQAGGSRLTCGPGDICVTGPLHKFGVSF
jgi:hypothetical protein